MYSTFSFIIGTITLLIKINTLIYEPLLYLLCDCHLSRGERVVPHRQTARIYLIERKKTIYILNITPTCTTYINQLAFMSQSAHVKWTLLTTSTELNHRHQSAHM